MTQKTSVSGIETTGEYNKVEGGASPLLLHRYSSVTGGCGSADDCMINGTETALRLIFFLSCVS